MAMTTIMLMAHSGWRWIVLILMVVTLLDMLLGWFSKRNWNYTVDSGLLTATRVSMYIQVALGIVLWILMGYWSNMRFTGEHAIVLLLALGAVEFGAARAKKLEDPTSKYKFGAIGLIIALVLVIVGLQAVGGVFV